jgi:Rrf2 family transcriptional regulator, iron-sulfur cluster assembly transcription factor
MLSNSCRYGIRAVIYLARNSSSDKKLGIKKISDDLGLPSPFLAKILQQLAKQKILSSSKGPKGGFSLLKDPAKITMLDMVYSIDGKDFFKNCLIHSEACTGSKSNKKHCLFHDDYGKIRNDIKKLFESKTITDMVEAANSEDSIFI